MSEGQELKRAMLKSNFAKNYCGVSRFSTLYRLLAETNPSFYKEMFEAGYIDDKNYSKKYLTPKQMAIVLKYFSNNEGE
jgi:ribosomal protein S8